MAAVLFGSISTLADTSELQRDAFNRAFAEHGLAWTWDRAEYIGLLRTSGGRDRIADYAAGLGQQVDADAVHATKSRIFQHSLSTTPPEPRPGVVETVQAATQQGLKVGLVTTTSPANVAVLLSALPPALQVSAFDVIIDRDDVAAPKPDPAAYLVAMERLTESVADCIAVEDNEDGVRSATDAGLVCVAFPNENTADHRFASAHAVVDRIELAELQALGAVP